MPHKLPTNKPTQLYSRTCYQLSSNDCPEAQYFYTKLAKFHLKLSFEVLFVAGYSYLSHRIIDSFPRIVKWDLCKFCGFWKPAGLGQQNWYFFMNFILLYVKNCLKYDALHDFSVWISKGSNPADMNRFQSNTGKD